MAEPPSLRFIHTSVRSKAYRVTKHATVMRLERGISMVEIEQRAS